jgi:ribonuclease HI
VNRIEAYTDGAAVKNGKLGSIGFSAVLLVGEERQEFSGGAPADPASSNLAELKGIALAFEAIRSHGWKPQEVLVFSDSEWAVRSIRGEQQAATHTELIQQIRQEMRRLPKAEVNWVRGHIRHALNERAHVLANEAARKAVETPCKAPFSLTDYLKRKPRTPKLPTEAPVLSLPQTRLDTIAQYPKADSTYHTVYVRWWNRLSDTITWPTEALQERLEEMGPERARLGKIVLYPPADLPGLEWKAAWTRLQRLEAQARAIEEALQRRTPRRGRTSVPGSAPPTPQPAPTLEAAWDPFAAE